MQEWFESPELQSCILRFAVSSVIDINEPGIRDDRDGHGHDPARRSASTGAGPTRSPTPPTRCWSRWGASSSPTWRSSKAIIENGTATGIRLADGSEIAARKLVVSTLSPHQLIFDLIGEEHVDDGLKRRVKLLEDTFGCLMWYSFAVHEAPNYKAEAFNPDIHECQWLGMQPDPDPMHIARECLYQKLHKFPPLEDYAPTVGCHSLVDPSFAPPGKHVVQNEQLGPPASAHTEKEWLEIKKRYADELMTLWQDYAPNMTWDNVIGVDTNSAYDHTRMKNLGPNGTMAGIDRSPHQVEENRPTPGAGQPPDSDHEPLRHGRILARGLECRLDRVVQLLQDHRQGSGARKAVGGGGKGRAGFAGRAAVSDPCRRVRGAGGTGGDAMTEHALRRDHHRKRSERAGDRRLSEPSRAEGAAAGETLRGGRGPGHRAGDATRLLPQHPRHLHDDGRLRAGLPDFEFEERYGVKHIYPELQVAMPLRRRPLSVHVPRRGEVVRVDRQVLRRRTPTAIATCTAASTS